jgi:hypothetical protein
VEGREKEGEGRTENKNLPVDGKWGGSSTVSGGGGGGGGEKGGRKVGVANTGSDQAEHKYPALSPL